jgi:hypothetical protein
MCVASGGTGPDAWRLPGGFEATHLEQVAVAGLAQRHAHRAGGHQGQGPAPAHTGKVREDSRLEIPRCRTSTAMLARELTARTASPVL